MLLYDLFIEIRDTQRNFFLGHFMELRNSHLASMMSHEMLSLPPALNIRILDIEVLFATIYLLI